MKNILLTSGVKSIGYSKRLAFNHFLMFLNLAKILAALLALSRPPLLLAPNAMGVELNNLVVFNI